MIEQVFADVNATNLRKSFYKKKDLIKEDGEDSTSQIEVKENEVMYDSDGNELIEHVSKNTMNDMLPLNAKASQSQADSTLGKRTRTEAENGQSEVEENKKDRKRRKPDSYSQFMKEQKQSQ